MGKVEGMPNPPAEDILSFIQQMEEEWIRYESAAELPIPNGGPWILHPEYAILLHLAEQTVTLSDQDQDQVEAA